MKFNDEEKNILMVLLQNEINWLSDNNETKEVKKYTKILDKINKA